MKKFICIFVLCCWYIYPTAFGQVGIGTNLPDSSAILELKSTQRGFLPPRMTTIQRDSIQNPAIGLIIYNLDCHCVNFFNGDQWMEYGRDPIESFSCGQVLVDSRTGKSYNTLQAGSQCWMAENLDVGNMISNTDASTDNNTIEKYCYGNAPANCTKFGALYRWDELMQYDTNRYNQGICPEGWHLPNLDEWDTLVQYYGGQSSAGAALREEGSSGFEALLGGGMKHDNSFYGKGNSSYFWSSASSDANSAWAYHLNQADDSFYKQDTSKQNAYPVRCIKGYPNRADSNVVVIDSMVYTLISDSAQLAQGIYQYTFGARSRDDMISAQNIIVGLTGEGYIREVDSLNQSGNQLTLHTTQATMEDVFESAEFSAQIGLGDTVIGGARDNELSRTYVRYLAKGVSFDQTRAGFQYNFLNVSLIEEENVSLTLNGSTSFDPVFDVLFNYNDNKVKKLGFYAMNAPFVNSIGLDLVATNSESLSFDKTKTIAVFEKYYIKWVGNWPVIIVMKTDLVVQGNINLNASFMAHTGITNTNNVSFGMVYENGSWNKIWNVEKTNTVDPLTWSGEVNLEQRFDIIPKVSMKIYGVTGPYFNLDLYELFNFGLTVPSMDWNSNLNVGIESTLGADVDVLGETLADYNTQIFGYETTLWEAPSSLEIISGDNQTGRPGQLLYFPIKIKVEDNLGNTYANIPVYFTVTSGGGIVEDAIVFTSYNGFAQTDWTLGETLGNQVVSVSVLKADGEHISGSPKIFSAICQDDLPWVTTSPVNDINSTTATAGGEVIDEGNAPVIARGVCWNQIGDPTISDSHSADGIGLGSYTSLLTELTPNTLYLFRAYATNSFGTSYGDQNYLITTPYDCGSNILITHVAGNVAPVSKTVTYGTVTNIPGATNKCWITSNLGADQQATSKDDATEGSAGWYWQFNRQQGFKHDGTSRTPNTTWIHPITQNSNWTITNDPCAIELGTGWRIPTLTEWQLVVTNGNWNNWNGPWNSTLKMHAAGYLNNSDNGILSERGVQGRYWSNTQFNGTDARDLNFLNNSLWIDFSNKSYGCTLRCIGDY